MRIHARQSSSNTANVYFGQDRGAPKHLAAGVLYGIPDVLNQIPDHFYQEMGFNYARIGGAQIDQVFPTELDALRANKTNTDPARRVRFLPYGMAVSVLDAPEATEGTGS